MSDQQAPQPLGTGPTPPRPAGTGPVPTNPAPAPKKTSWVVWLLGGLGVGVFICVIGIAITTIFTLTMLGNRVSQVFTQIDSGLNETSVAYSTAGVPAANLTPIYDPTADAQADIDQALKRAKQNNTLVLLDFGADWCPDCVVLSDHFESPKVKPYLDEHFEVVKINVGEWDTNLDISKKYGDPIEKGIPAIVILDANGKIKETTRAGELANARTITEKEVLDILHQWAKK